MDLSHGGKAYVASCVDSQIYLIEKSSGNKVIEYSGHDCGSFGIGCKFNMRDSKIITGSTDGKVYVYDIMKK